MKTLLLLSIGLFSITLPSMVTAQAPNANQIKIAQQNHNNNCPKDLPSALFNPQKLKNYQMRWQLEKGLIYTATQTTNSDQTALPDLVESAITPQNIAFKMTQSGCEFVNEQLEIDLPITAVEKNGKFCNECFIQSLKSLKPYFLEDRGGLFIGGLDTLNHDIKNQKIRVKHEYVDSEGGEMAHSITIDYMQKIPSENIWRIQLTVSIGPL